MSFKIGDTVKLKSGSPDMTVMRIGTAGEEPMVWCVWFEGSKDAYGLFPPEALEGSSELGEVRKSSDAEQVAKPSPEPLELFEPLSQPQRTEADSAPATPEAAEALSDPHPTQADSSPLAPKTDIEAQIVSIQSMISGLLKRS
jgi:uncharacterized protein YodC (DUF2158 family)